MNQMGRMGQHEAEALVCAALDAARVRWQRRRDGELCLHVLARGQLTPVVLRVREDRLTMYALLPVRCEEERMALACNALNRDLGDGCLVADQEGRALLKQTAYLTDALYAPEIVERALGRQRYLISQCTGALERWIEVDALRPARAGL